ncbi:MAG: ABC transporter permease subunit [Brachybacterium sp.]|uniref:ABC transporter permease n=1 Tax=Brachybacterium sp. TaxID=1891286 RepID=UPI0026476E4E|nr:ABC transporter permease subunit [Brachybacterium sp.]MDN5688162.1 ABC transporter permease subunit [Brachybacterium sp.]
MSATESAEKLPWRRRFLSAVRHHPWMYAFVLPGLLFFVVFHYVPLLGNVIAFQDFSPYLGIADSRWVGMSNFADLFRDPEVIGAIVNTLIISFLQLAFAFPAPIALAIFLNSLLSERLKRWIQTVVYLPHFLSWVIVVALWQQVLGGAGSLARGLEMVGIESVNIMSDPSTFKLLVVAQVIWKDVGWGTIIFFAAISTISAELYESAAVDGAGPWRRIWHVTLPGLIPVTVMMLILQLGNVLTVGFEQLLLQQPAVGADAAQVIDTFVYFRGIAGGEWGISAAVGLIKGVIGTVLVLGANRLAKRLGTDGLF